MFKLIYCVGCDQPMYPSFEGDCTCEFCYDYLSFLASEDPEETIVHPPLDLEEDNSSADLPF